MSKIKIYYIFENLVVVVIVVVVVYVGEN